MKEKHYNWLEYCQVCKRKHYITLKSCPECNVYETPQPVSEKVYEHCSADYSCDGCQAYREHTRPYIDRR